MPLGTNAMWGVVLPVEKTNLVLNPSYERGSAGAAANVGATLSLSSSRQARGAFSLQVLTGANGTSGAYVGSFTPPTAGEGYSISADLSLPANSRWRFGIERTDTGAQQYGTVIGGGTWQRIGSSFTIASVVDHRILVFKDTDTTTYSFNADGIQAEVGSVTTYIDGDQEGCVWNGQPHLSSSLRSGQSRAGGSVVALADLGFRVDDAHGIGMAPLETSSQSYALIPGAEFQSQRAEVRPFVLSTQMGGTTWRDFHNTRRTVINALKIDAVAEQQPTRFWYVGGEGTVQIDAVMDAGMEGGNKSGFTESYGVRFLAHDPYWEATMDQGTALASRTALGSMNYIIKRDRVTGAWGTLGVNGTTTSGPIYDLAVAPNGMLIGAGSFDTAGGTRSTHTFQFSHASQVFGTLVGGTLVGDCSTLAINPGGTVFIAGPNLSSAGGTAARWIAQHNGASWGTLPGGTINNSVSALCYTSAGSLFVGGNLTVANNTTAWRVAFWSGGAWGTLTNQQAANSGSMNGAPGVIVETPTKAVLIGGAFGSAGGTAARLITQWNGTFGTLSYGVGGAINPSVSAAAYLTSGVLAAGGALVNGTFGTVLANCIGQWNGIQWSAMGSGVLTTLNGLMSNPTTGELIAAGVFSQVEQYAFNPSVLYSVYNGYRWLPGDVLFPSAAVNGAYGALLMPDNSMYLFGDFRGIGTVAGVAQLVNAGGAEAYPTLKVRNTGSGTARVFQWHNVTTNSKLYFDLNLQSGEEVTLTLTPGARSFQSSARGNIFPSILPGSNLASWRLLPGTNYVSFFADVDTLTASVYWRPRSWSADGTVM